MSVSLASGAPSSGVEQVFYSGDEDVTNLTQYEENNDVDFSELDHGSTEYYRHLANVSDITFKTTAPDDSFDGTTLLEYRRGQVASYSTDDDEHINTIGGSRSDGKLEGVTTEIIGVHGGARPRRSNRLPHLPPVTEDHYIGQRGSVLLHTDYKIDMSDSYCKPDDDPDDGSEGEIEYCWDYSLDEVDKTLELTMNGESIERGPPSTEFSYSNAPTGETTVRVGYTVEVEYTIEEEKHRYENGSWDEIPLEDDDDDGSSKATASDEIDAYVTGDDDLRSIEQTVINVSEDRKRVIVHFPSTNKSKTMADARGRLWSELEFDETVVEGPWRMYTKQNDHYSHLDPTPLEQYLVSVRHRPRVTSTDVGANETGAFSRARLISWEGSNLSRPTAANDNVQVNTTEPQLYDRIVVDRVEEPASSITTIHGRRIDLSGSAKTIEYREPDVSIESIPDSDDKVRIEVTDPANSGPVVGYPVRLFGTTQRNLTTNASGVITADRQNMVVRADVVGDDLQGLTDQPSNDTLYADARETRVFMDGIDVMERLYDLVFALVAVSPLIFLYFYIRHFQFFD